MTPTMIKSRLVGLLLACTALLVGAFMYLTWRPDVVYLNQFFFSFLDPESISWLQSISFPGNLPLWLLGSLPDGMWMFAFVIIMMIIWDFRLDRKSLPWIVMVLVAGTSYEVLQGLHWISGTFDAMDLVFMCIGAMVPLSFIFIKYNLCKNYSGQSLP